MLEQFQSYGLQAEFHIYSHNGSRRNVVATLPGLVDPTKVVYLTAHFDATSENPQVCAPGADDNASGTAAVLEAARVMAGFPFQYTVKFALFNSEEQGLIGSAAYVEDIAAAGEDVIAAYNMDMIAYRGSDPAPPDLIVYTNSASQAFATAVETAADTYVPGQIDVRVLVESMSSSDHSSFWDHGYRAVCAIEEEAWGSDFCPWYHTCDDRIERYPHDYPTACTKANVAAAAHAALPFSPDGPFLVVASSQVDDDASGGSQGNGDGALNPGETIELSVALQNVGGAAATGVTGELSTESPYVTLLQPGAAWPDIPSGGSASNAVPFRFQIDPGVPDGAAIPLTLEVSDQSGVRAFGLEFPVVAPDLAVCFYRIGEQLGGNGNGIIDPGEPVELTVRVRNRGGQDAAAVAATLSSLSGHLTVVEGNSGAVLIPSGQEAELDPPFRVLASAEALEGEVLELALGLETGLYAAQSGLKLKVGTSYYDEVEGETAWSLGAVGDDATSGLWIAADPVGTVYEGSIAQTEDDHTADPGVACFVTGNGSPGGAAGEQDVDGGKTTLVTPVFDLTHHVDPRVTYWRWYTNDLGNNPGQDTWLVQVSSDGGTSWVDLERTTSSENSWQQRSFALAGLITPSAQVVFRFVAEDLSPGTLVEAAIDDFEVSGTIQTVAADDASVPAALRLDSPQPNPLVRGGAISFALPRAGEARVQLFNAGGRLARTLADGTMEAGMRRLAWDGLGNDRRPLPAGVYYLRLQAGEEVRTRSVVLAR